MYRFRGEPFVYDTLPILTEDCALNEAIGHITIASNATLMPSEECMDILVRNSSKIDVRYSVFECVREEHRKQLIDTLKKNGVNVETYHFIFGNDKWYDSGDYMEFNNVCIEYIKNVLHDTAGR